MHIMIWVAGALFLILHTWAFVSLRNNQRELRRKQDFTLKVVQSGLLMNIKERTLIKSVFGIQYVLHKENRKLIVITSEGEEKVSSMHAIVSLYVSQDDAIEFIQDLKSVNKEIINFEKLEKEYA